MSTTSFAPYGEYAPASANWLGSIPKGWRVLRGKYTFREYSARSETGTEVLLSVSEYFGVKPRREAIAEDDYLSRAESLVGYKKCAVDDLAMNIMLAWKKGLGVSKYEGIVSPAYSVFRFREHACPDYMHYLLRTDLYADYFKARSTGIMDSRLRLYPDVFGDVALLLPPKTEQTQIAKFLDYETAKIDALIEKQQQLIALLKEKRQAVISHAVTKGLNPDAPMRDSGVEWLGEVPAHWAILAVRHALKIDNGPRLPINRLERARMAGPYPYWGPTGVLDHIDHYRYEGDRVIIGEDGDHFLKFAIWPMTHWVTGKFNVNNHAHVVADGPKCSAKWFYYSFLHRDIGGDVIAQGVSRLKLTREGLSKLVLSVPPLDEQAALIAHMEPVIAKVEKATAAAEQQIKLLQERRTALISAAVTGKVDVRSWKAPNPELEEVVA